MAGWGARFKGVGGGARGGGRGGGRARGGWKGAHAGGWEQQPWSTRVARRPAPAHPTTPPRAAAAAPSPPQACISLLNIAQSALVFVGLALGELFWPPRRALRPASLHGGMKAAPVPGARTPCPPLACAQLVPRAAAPTLPPPGPAPARPRARAQAWWCACAASWRAR